MSDRSTVHTSSTTSRQLVLCQNDSLPEVGKCNVLLVEPAMTPRSERDTLLGTTNCCVTSVRDVREMFNLRLEKPIVFAVLNDLLGTFDLRAAAESVRRQWPAAKILIIGSAVPTLEDHLYDDAISHRHDEKELLSALQALLDNCWTQRMMGHKRPVASVQESDPTKVIQPVSGSNVPKNEPNGIYRMRATA